ncbi:helix-turn-helix domain-containing protein [Bacillus mojavensis]
MSEFSNRLKELRKSKGDKISQGDVASAIGISQSAYASYEQGNREPNIERLIMISKYFGVSLDFLIRGDGKDLPIESDPSLSLIKNAIKDIEKKSSYDKAVSYLEKVSREELQSDKRLKRAILKATKKILDNEMAD